jgi:hypothetical protein
MHRPAVGFLVFLASSPVLAQNVDVPLNNWTVPPYSISSSSGIHTMVDATPPRLFIGLPPCRLLDTRPPDNNPLDGDGPYVANEARVYTLPGACGIPGGTDAVSLNITVTNTQASPFGFIKIWPQGGTEPNVSTLNWSTGGDTVANAAIVPLSGAGGIAVRSANAGSDVILDVNGYFSDTLGSPANSLGIFNNSNTFSIKAVNSSLSCAGACGIVAEVSSTAGAWAIEGAASGVNGRNYGVHGIVSSSTNGSAGVFGEATTSAGTIYGVLGEINSGVGSDSAGVRGIAGSVGVTGGVHRAGVRGESSASSGSVGVLGISRFLGVTGYLVDAFGNIVAEGRLGFTGPYGVYSFGNYGGSGAKYFVEPHPRDASKVIRYVALEGPEAGTYFRGRGKFDRGIARIAVPEDFRMVTDEEGLTVQVTPIGQMATFSVLKADLDEIVVQASRNVEFYYLVQGIRQTHKHLTSPIGEGTEYAPRSADATMPGYLTEGQKKFLVQNGTYNADGTVNIETARRLGWDRVWAEGAGRPVPAPTP